MAFELIFAFDEAISLGHKENVTITQVKQYCEMESHEEKLHKLLRQSKINETKDVMKRKASEIDKSKVCFSVIVTFVFNLVKLVFSEARWCYPFCKLINFLSMNLNQLPRVGYLRLSCLSFKISLELH